MTRRLVERFRVGDVVEVARRERDGGVPDVGAWDAGVVVAHAHPGVWVEHADGSRWFVTNGGRIRRAARGETGGAVVWKIATRDEWGELRRTGAWAGSADDRRDGFVHLSAPDQVAGTAERHFAGRDDLVLLEIPTEGLDAEGLRWEPSRGGALFPHLYGALRLRHVARVVPLRRGADGRWVPPADA